MRALIFLGPTLRCTEASLLLQAEYSPPARRHSLGSVEPGRVVAIIDGELTTGAALDAAEIKTALDRGVTIYGSSSVGAYYAALLKDFGMRGIGWIYEQYRTKRLISLDEVAVLYDPVSLQPLSIPVVNIQYWLDSVIAARILDVDIAHCWLEKIQHTNLFERDLSTILDYARKEFGSRTLRTMLDLTNGCIPDIKAGDARRLLSHLSNLTRTSIKEDGLGVEEFRDLLARP
jgi:hypothetical protein